MILFSFVDETSHILKIQTGKQLYKQGHKNVKEITKKIKN